MTERRPIPVYLSLEEAAECTSVSVKTFSAGSLAGRSRPTAAAIA